MGWFLSALAVAVLVYVGICLFYFILQERFIFIGLPLGRRYRFRFTKHFTEHWILRPDGGQLHALWFRSAKSGQVVLYFHGNTGNLRRWGRLAARFTQLGMDVVMPDPRGYGKSRGIRSEAILIADAVAWFDYVSERASRPPVVYGRSLGGALAVPVAAERRAPMLLLETPFANLIDVARAYLPLLPYRWLLRYPFQNDRRAMGLNCPTCIFHGTRDQVVPYTSALKLYAALPTTIQRELVTIPNGGHNDLYRHLLFRKRLAEWLSTSGQA